jgi:hypothetical protein
LTLYLPTLYVLAATAILLILWDIEVVWRKGAPATISWLTLTLWLSYPWLMAVLFGLGGHLFWPKCGTGQSLTPLQGTILGVGAIGVILWEVAMRFGNRAVPKLTRLYGVRLALIALLAFVIGHAVFGQYVVCQ